MLEALVQALGEAVEKHSPLNAEADPGETPEPRGRLRDAGRSGKPEVRAGFWR